ncbi:MAG TPA: tyrosine-type recombinase/integrase [Acidimicrobiia bacterium]|nr:tyrosine-type recombinase/integrase [Acidimicrobiia bacterium]
MASIKKREDGRWRARYRDLDGTEHAKHFSRRIDAEIWLDSVRVDLSTGVHVNPARGRVTFETWSKQWQAEAVHLKPKTRAGYQSILNKHLLPHWEHVRLSEIDRPAVKAWVATMIANGMGAGTVKNVVNTMKAVMSSAVEGGAIKVNPCVGVRLPRPTRTEMLFLTAPQVAQLAEAIGPDHRALLLFAAYTGLRAGEIGALQWGRVNLLRGTVDVVESYAEVHGALVLGTTKTYARRTVRLPRFLCDLLGEHQAITGPDGLVFRDSHGGPLRHSNFYRRAFRPSVARSGLPARLRFHDLRHTCVALLVAQGAHPMAIKERLGHSSITVTLDQYGHLLPAIDEALAEGLETTYREAAADFSRTIRGLEPVAVLSTTGS